VHLFLFTGATLKPAAQRTEEVLVYSGSMAAGETISASLRSRGHSRVVGALISSASSAGLNVRQSIDFGVNWDYVTACNISACDIDDSAFSIEIIGDSVKVEFTNGADVSASTRTRWTLRPI